jgi:hypothetical protein
MVLRKRFCVAMAIYAVLGLVIWWGMDNIALPVTSFGGSNWGSGFSVTLKQLTLAIWAMFVVRTVLHWRAEEIRAEREHQEQREGVS